MSKKTFVHDSRYSAKFSDSRDKLRMAMKILLGLTVAAAVLFLSYYGAIYLSSSKIDNTLDKFNISCEEGDYETAFDYYRKYRDVTLSGSPIFNRNKYSEVLIIMEKKIVDIIDSPINDLIKGSAPLDDADLRMFTHFKEITLIQASKTIKKYVSDYLNGSYSRENVEHVLTELMRSDELYDTMLSYMNEMDNITDFIPVMQTITQLYADKEYFETIELIWNEIGRRSGFVKDYLAVMHNNVKNEAYPTFVDDIDVMMSAGKYYSAKGRLMQIMPYYSSNNDLQVRYDECMLYADKVLTEFIGPVEHIAIRPLISTPDFDFSANSYALNAEDLMITTDEFRSILTQLYENGYILIDINSLIDSKNKYRNLMIPEGKKPLILSIEGLNYYATRRMTGNSINLVLDENGYVASEYFNKEGQKITDRNGEAIGILEQFIESHPEFSFDGAKGNISLTGFECIFGYVTNPDQIDDRTSQFNELNLGSLNLSDSQIQTNREVAIDIINKLKSSGWTFSSSTYGNISVGETTLENLIADTQKWVNQVESLVGESKVLLFPNGSVVSSKDSRGGYLINQGFVIHCGIGPTAYFNIGTSNLFMDRVALNGIALRSTDLSRFFDVREVYDSGRTKILK